MCSLRVNGLGPKGAAALAPGVAASASLKKLNLDGFELSLPQLRGTEPVETLDLSGKGLCVASGIVIASLIEGNSAMIKVQ